MLLMQTLINLGIVALATASGIGSKTLNVERGSDGLQDIVTYDESSLMVYGERIFLFSGEFHPYRLPVPGLWIDILEKIKALGFNAVSFYVNWALMESEPGHYLSNEIFGLEPFFEAAQQAGIYLIARPGPYINAESSGGGFPGWLQRNSGQLRTRAPDYLAATSNYVAHVGEVISKAQITNGGPIILVQPENEYSWSAINVTGGFPDPIYMAYVKSQYRNAGIVVPFVNNDSGPQGRFAPGYIVDGTTEGDVDIYGFDNYPLGFDCSNPYNWTSGSLPTDFYALHERQSPSTFCSIEEFQGGSFDPWGGTGYADCATMFNMEFERVFNKNNFASGVKLMNLYMIYGGTNWGNLGYAGGYTSYDYGAAINENREVIREKYSELKLEAQFLRVSPTYLTATVGTGSSDAYTDSSAIFVTPLWGNGSRTNFYIVRRVDYTQDETLEYTLSLNTSMGLFSIPQLAGNLTLSGRDSKWHVTDYDLEGTTLLYSTAEIFTWKKFNNSTVLIVYGGSGERHELSVVGSQKAQVIEGNRADVATKTTANATTIGWTTEARRHVVKIGDLLVYMLDRNTAYDYWVPDFARKDQWGAYASSIGNTSSVIVKAGYLVRSVSMDGSTLNINGDLNSTVPISILGAPSYAKELSFNGQKIEFDINPTTGEWLSSLSYNEPQISLPELSSLSWKYLDNLPEVQSSYNDAAWTDANLTSNNRAHSLSTPTSLFGSDYGYNSGVLIFRGWFLAVGNESTLSLSTQGGLAFGSSVFLNSTYIGSWTGSSGASSNNATYTLPRLTAGSNYVFTILVDNNGLDENAEVGADQMKNPRGILDYDLSGRRKPDITWKITGNLGGETYVDKTRGPLNEGGLYAERQGFTQPNPPSYNWPSGDPETGIPHAGVALYQASFDLDLPRGYDIPLTFNFGNTTINNTPASYRAQLWVNGYQFGKYINHIGPQTSFPVPQGILNYYGTNWLAIELWAQQKDGSHLTDLSLQAVTSVLTSLEAPQLAPAPSYSERSGAY